MGLEYFIQPQSLGYLLSLALPLILCAMIVVPIVSTIKTPINNGHLDAETITVTAMHLFFLT